MNLEELRKFERIALVSVFNKDGIVDRVQRLVDLGFGIYAYARDHVGVADFRDRHSNSAGYLG